MFYENGCLRRRVSYKNGIKDGLVGEYDRKTDEIGIMIVKRVLVGEMRDVEDLVKVFVMI